MTQQDLDTHMTERFQQASYLTALTPETIFRLAYMEGFRDGGRDADAAWVKRWDEATEAKDAFVRRVGGGL